MKRFLLALLYVFLFIVMLAGFIQSAHNPDACSSGWLLRQERC